MKDLDLVTQISQLLYDKKADDILALRVGHLTVLAVFLVIATGRTAIAVRALCDHLDEFMAQKGLEPRRVEGKQDGAWVVMDYANITVHIFKPDAREYYHLERLWEDGQNRIKLPFLEKLEA